MKNVEKKMDSLRKRETNLYEFVIAQREEKHPSDG